MRVAWLVLVLGCGASPARGPAWPKTAAVETDGGESLAPATATTRAAAAAAAEDDDLGDDDAADLDAKPAAPTAAAKPAAASTGATPAATPSTTDEPIMTEEIVIEIED